MFTLNANKIIYMYDILWLVLSSYLMTLIFKR